MSENPTENSSRISALFANLVVQQTNMALMLLGRVPHPETGERVQEFEAAQMFIDQLEMIEVKTRGNLSPQEQQLLKQSLTNLRMAFVEAVEGSGAASAEQAKAAPDTTLSGPSGTIKTGAAESDESRKKFSKRY